ncbi:GWxTD domain-containing protein [Rhodohalobacter barkolensis]|uniref:GWxTD domain-containing protein n=1 Tax=Rhodohalobacter barkolensis TaxID=2053187 RepID=A0A2N0VFN5_9BACT|nr:GWxTD domain-containing protein [Rhodohalobacter barkolensis]PKD42995.1 GWxTD domain-containing protein [Rhodohalobacter barkolensis]
MNTHLKKLLTGLLLFLGIMLSGCVRSSNPDVERGSLFQFQDGYPELRSSSIGFLSEQDQPLINVTTDVVLGSLIYSTEDDKRLANITLEIRILQLDGDFTKTVRRDFEIESDFEGTYISQEVFTNEEIIEVVPGTFEVNITVLDQSSGRASSQESEATIPNPEDPEINLTTIRLSGKNLELVQEQFSPITTYTIPAKIDSLKFEFQVTNNDLDDPLTIDARLLKYPADTSYARPMNFNNYSPSSLPYIGVDMRRAEEIDSNVRRLDQPGSVLIEFKYPLLERGTYRFEVETTDIDGETLYRGRDFSVVGENYPSVMSARELAEPLIYLMDRRDHERMMEIQDPDSLKEAVDRFWLSNVRNMNQARSVINLYYDRVEQANKQFTTFKEGWKTDMGMIYVLFGPPWYVDRYLNTMQWSYSYDRNDPQYNFTFQRPNLKNEFFPFDNYLLQRNQGYFNVQYRQVQLWLTGGILTNRL